jgi:hypothetical protein
MSVDKQTRVEQFLEENVFTVLLVVLVFALTAVLIAVVSFAANFHSTPVAQTVDAWGQFGDFFGGVLNPVFGFLSVFGLLAALVLQTKELKASRAALEISQRELELSRQAQTESAEALKMQNEAIRIQSFEQTFFSWFQSYKNLLQDIETKPLEIPSGGMGDILNPLAEPVMQRGVAALKQFWRRYLTEDGIQIHFMHLLTDEQWKVECEKYAPNSLALDANEQVGNPSSSRKHLIPSEKFIQLLFHFRKENGTELVIKAVLNGWFNLYSQHGHQVGVLFRSLYRLIKWIDEQKTWDSKTKWQYVSIVRSQLTRYEQTLLFYNALSDQGAKFKTLIERYALFDNLGVDGGTGPESERLIFLVQWENPAGKQYADSAFSSELAKAALS